MSLDTDKMAPLRQRFLDSVREQAERLEALLGTGDLESIRALAHSLAGRSGMFGFTDLGAVAKLADEADAATLPDRARDLLTALRGLSQGG